MSSASLSVAYVVRHVHHYREPFYRGLKVALEEQGIHMDLLYGQPGINDENKNDWTMPEWGTYRESRILNLRGQEIIYQPWFRELLTRDLVVVEQASRLLLNYLLIARRALGRGPRITMAGHGQNLNTTPSAIGEALKRRYTTRLDWFFAYTEGSKDKLAKSGFPAERITAFQNTLDLDPLRADIASVTSEEVAAFRAELGLTRQNLVICLGSLYPDKRPDLMVATADALNKARSDVDVLVIGSGVDEEIVRSAAAERPWLAHRSAAFGHDKAVALAAADFVLVPGVSGLVILDAFVACLPVVTAATAHHPPEIDYVVSGENGIVLPEGTGADEFAAELGRIIDSPAQATRLGTAAGATGDTLTIDNMISLFAGGIGQALAFGGEA